MDSDEFTTSDEGKRKRVEVGELFKKSKRTPRTPTKEEGASVDMMAQMMRIMKDLAADVKEIKAEQQRYSDEMKSLNYEIKELRTEQKEYREEIKKLKEINEKNTEEIHDLRKEITYTNERLEKLERKNRRKNVVVQGLQIETGNHTMLRQGMGEFLKKELGIEVEVNAARKIGDKSCIIELSRDEDKNKVMQNKNKLRYLKGERIYINDDMTKMEREIQRKIRNKAKEEKMVGKNVRVGFQKLIVDNEVWRWEKDKGQLDKVVTKSDKPKN